MLICFTLTKPSKIERDQAPGECRIAAIVHWQYGCSRRRQQGRPPAPSQTRFPVLFSTATTSRHFPGMGGSPESRINKGGACESFLHLWEIAASFGPRNISSVMLQSKECMAGKKKTWRLRHCYLPSVISLALVRFSRALKYTYNVYSFSTVAMERRSPMHSARLSEASSLTHSLD